MLEKKLETPWKIHLNRMGKGLGPTNVRWNKHEEYFKIPEFRQKKEDYLYKSAEEAREYSIYTKIPKVKVTHGFELSGKDVENIMKEVETFPNEEKYYIDPKDPVRSKTNKQLELELNGSDFKEKPFVEIFEETMKNTYRNQNLFFLHLLV